MMTLTTIMGALQAVARSPVVVAAGTTERIATAYLSVIPR